MAKTIEKLAELDYNELITLGMMEQCSDLKEIFTDEIKIPFPMLYTLQREGNLNDETKELLVDLFENLILTSKDLISKYQRLLAEPIQEVVDLAPELDEKIIFITEAYKVKHDKEPAKPTKEGGTPRRYGRVSVLKDIQEQGGKATTAQRASLKNNCLKNLYVSIDRRLIKKMLTDDESLSDDDCRKIASAITTFERQIEDILKRK